MGIAGRKCAQVATSKKCQSSCGLVSTVSNKRNSTATDFNFILCYFPGKSYLHFSKIDLHCNNKTQT